MVPLEDCDPTHMKYFLRTCSLLFCIMHLLPGLLQKCQRAHVWLVHHTESVEGDWHAHSAF